jgi:hypothetical protein
MATEYVGLPGQLLDKVREAAAKEEITPGGARPGRGGDPPEPLRMAQDS